MCQNNGGSGWDLEEAEAAALLLLLLALAALLLALGLALLLRLLLATVGLAVLAGGMAVRLAVVAGHLIHGDTNLIGPGRRSGRRAQKLPNAGGGAGRPGLKTSAQTRIR